jgi:hypothetical protein
MPNCSKAPRGLFVLLRTDGIFTVNALSPSSSLRQYPYHYSIRAGQNLPDKEFRYLRTVIVTAAVHWGFSSRREAIPLTFQHRAGVSPYTSTFVLAETYVFGKQLHGFLSCSPLTLLMRQTLRFFSSRRALAEPKSRAALFPFGLMNNHYANVFGTALFLICLKKSR